MCKHENNMLVGMVDGIRCQGCGKVFHSFDEMSERVQEVPEEASERVEGKSRKKGGRTKND